MLVVGVVRHPDGVVDREEVVLEALVDEVLVVRVADKAVGARAHRELVHRKVAAPLHVRLREDRHLADAGQVDDEKGRIGLWQFERPRAVVHGLVLDPGLGPSGRDIGAPAAGVIGRQAAVVVFGETAHALVAEDHVVGGEDRAVVERRRGNRRPDRDGVDPLRCGERWDRVAIAGIHLHGRVEDGAMGVVVGGAAGTRLIHAPGVGGDRGDDRGVQIDLVERPGHGKLGVLGHAARDGRRSRAGGLPGRLGGLLGRGDGRGGGLGRGFGGLLSRGGGRPGGGGRLAGGGCGGGSGVGGGGDGGLRGGRGGGAGLDGGSRVAGGLGGGLGSLGGGVRDGRGRGVAGSASGVGGLGGGRSRGFRGGGRVGGVFRLGRLGGQGGGGIGGVGGLRSRSGGLGCGGRRLGRGGRRFTRGTGRGARVTRRRVDRRRINGGRCGVIVIVAAADERKASRSNASLRAGSQHGAARDLPLSQGGPVVTVAHGKILPGFRAGLMWDGPVPEPVWPKHRSWGGGPQPNSSNRNTSNLIHCAR